MKVILDTSGWYSFVSEDDRFHELAVNFINKNKPFLLILYPVLEELTAILHHRKGKKLTLEAIDVLKNTSIGKILYLNDREDNEIWMGYKLANDSIDYVDSAVIWLSKKMNVPIFSFDSHFKKLGLKVLS